MLENELSGEWFFDTLELGLWIDGFRRKRFDRIGVPAERSESVINMLIYCLSLKLLNRPYTVEMGKPVLI